MKIYYDTEHRAIQVMLDEDDCASLNTEDGNISILLLGDYDKPVIEEKQLLFSWEDIKKEDIT